MYRHGDLLVAAVPEIPPGARRLSHLTLAEGEMTGHSHRIAEGKQATLYSHENQLYLDVTGDGATLVHQEHGPIVLPRGTFRAWKQREYSPREIRFVRD
jgi:hypothetical protein